MPITLKPANGAGGCCDCGVIVDPCTCNNGCSLECRSKAAAAELCGFDEFADPSVPPKRYRRQTFSGQYTGNVYLGADCTSHTGTFELTWSGAAVYDQASCTLIEQGTETVVENPGGTTQNPLTEFASEASCLATVTLTLSA